MRTRQSACDPPLQSKTWFPVETTQWRFCSWTWVSSSRQTRIKVIYMAASSSTWARNLPSDAPANCATNLPLWKNMKVGIAEMSYLPAKSAGDIESSADRLRASGWRSKVSRLLKQWCRDMIRQQKSQRSCLRIVRAEARAVAHKSRRTLQYLGIPGRLAASGAPKAFAFMSSQPRVTVPLKPHAEE